LRLRLGKDDGKRGRVVGEQDVGHTAVTQLGADRDVPEQREGQGSGRAAAPQNRFERGRGIEDRIDSAGLQRLIGLTSFGHIHPRDLVDQTREVTTGQLAMDDGPDHASLLTARERQRWCRSPI
jgi:hypothetical protein